MINPKPIIFENPVLYSEHTFKRNRFSDEEMMFITGKSKNKDSSSKPKMCIALNKNRYNTIFLFTHGECSLKIGLRDYVLKPNDLVIIPELDDYPREKSESPWKCMPDRMVYTY